MVLERFNCYGNTAVSHFRWLMCKCSGSWLTHVNWIHTFSGYPSLSTDCAGMYCRKIYLKRRHKSNNKNEYWILSIKGNSLLQWLCGAWAYTQNQMGEVSLTSQQMPLTNETLYKQTKKHLLVLWGKLPSKSNQVILNEGEAGSNRN